MRLASHFSETQIRAIERLAQIFPKVPCVLVGANAIGCWLDYQWRSTSDLDLTIAVNFEDFPGALETAAGWKHDARFEHSWTSPEGVLVDVLPAGDRILDAGEIVWKSGARMNMTGF